MCVQQPPDADRSRMLSNATVDGYLRPASTENVVTVHTLLHPHESITDAKPAEVSSEPKKVIEKKPSFKDESKVQPKTPEAETVPKAEVSSSMVSAPQDMVIPEGEETNEVPAGVPVDEELPPTGTFLAEGGQTFGQGSK